MRSISPTTEELLAEYPVDSNDSLDRKLTESHEALAFWSETTFERRSQLFKNAASELRKGVNAYSRRMTDEMGKPIRQARAEVEKCAWVCEYYAEHGPGFLERQVVNTDATRSYVTFEPLGTILAIMPWNFPFWQVFRCAVPTLMAGNTVALKHAPNVPGCALSIEEVFVNAGFPPGVFTNLFIPEKKVDHVIEDHRISAVALTGSVGAGQAVAQTAGKAIKKCVLELGGSDPFIVLEDCNLERTVEQAVFARMQNNGQSCIAAKRFIVEQSIYDEFVAKLHRRLSQLVVGDPHAEETDIGPLARKDLRDTLHRQVRKTIKRGAECRLGGEPLDGAGFFYPPTLLVDVDETMVAFEEETFGPVAAVTMALDADEAIVLANRSQFGLGASIWTETARGEALAHRIVAGTVAVNDIVKSNPFLPMGGVKHSGYGRELSGFGLMEFVNIKTIWVR